jgi:AraC-like DNA-binding protein
MIRTQDPDFRNWLLLADPGYKAYLKRLSACFKDWRISLEPDPHQATDFFFHNEVRLVLLGHSAQAPCLDLLNFFKSVKPSIPVIVLAESGGEELVLSLFRNGAWDCFKKPLPMNELKRSTELALTAKRQFDPGPKREGIFKAVRYIHEKFATRLRLAQIARESAMGLSSFERTFKKEMGTTYSKFLNKFRVSKAAGMLEQKTLSISEVAFSCGFNNPYHFSRMFKRLMQISPRDYRKSFRD